MGFEEVRQMRVSVCMGSQSPYRFVVEGVVMTTRLTLCTLLRIASLHSQSKDVEKQKRVHVIALVED